MFPCLHPANSIYGSADRTLAQAEPQHPPKNFTNALITANTLKDEIVRVGTFPCVSVPQEEALRLRYAFDSGDTAR